MKDIKNIKRIRWSSFDGGRWYGVSTPIRKKEKDSTRYVVNRPIEGDGGDSYAFTKQGAAIANTLIKTQGIREVQVTSFGIIVVIEPVYKWAEFHDDIVKLLNDTLFNGEADVDQLGARKADEGLIRWSGTRKDAVRWYGVSTAIITDIKSKTSKVVSGPLTAENNWPGLTEAGLEVVNAIHAMPGVYTIWVTPFDLSIEIAPVFTWSDFHNDIVELLTEKVFGGKAFVEQREAA